MTETLSENTEITAIREAVRELCSRFTNEYWRELEPDTYPAEFVDELTAQGWLAALIPEQYGGAGLGLTAASVILEEINASGGNAAACHAQMYTMGTVLRHGTEEQKRSSCRGSRRARSDFKHSGSPSRLSAPTRLRSARSRVGWTTDT